MAGETTSTNMSLPIPGTGVTAGPDWADDYNACLNIIDGHTHAAGSGVQITPSGINITSDLTFNSVNSATNVKKTVFTSQSSALTGTNFLSFVSGNLYVNDGSGNQIAITAAGSVAGTAGSIASLAAPASATYVAGSKLFQWQSGASKAGAMDNGAVTIRETDVASAKGITLQSPSSLAADIAFTLPAALPASTQYLTSTNAGVTSFSTANQIAAAMTSTGADAIGATMTSTGANAVAASRTRATGTTVGAGGVAISASSSTYATTSSSLADITNLSVTITTSGRPVKLLLIGADTSNNCYFRLQGTTTSAAGDIAGVISPFRDATVLPAQLITYAPGVNSISFGVDFPAAWSYVDAVGAGTYTYKLQASVVGANVSSPQMRVYFVALVAYEL